MLISQKCNRSLSFRATQDIWHQSQPQVLSLHRLSSQSHESGAVANPERIRDLREARQSAVIGLRCGCAHLSELVVSPINQGSRVQACDLSKPIDQVSLQTLTGLCNIAMCASDRLLDNAIDDAIGEIVFGRQSQCRGCLCIGRLIGFLPQNGGTSFGTDDGIPSKLEHVDTIRIDQLNAFELLNHRYLVVDKASLMAFLDGSYFGDDNQEAA